MQPQFRSTSIKWSARARFLNALAAGITALCIIPASSYAAAPTDWMVNGGYGIGVHWTTLSLPAGGGSRVTYCTAVNNFDVNNFAQQLVDAGANYVLFTISHAEMYFAFPNPRLEGLFNSIGVSRTCTRDLYSDLYNALNPKGIKMMFYYPSFADPNQDSDWYYVSQRGVNNAYFAQLQYDLVADVGARYGTKLAGWWVDNLWTTDLFNLYNVFTYTASLRTSSATRDVAYNLGSCIWNNLPNAQNAASFEDYQAGEGCDANDNYDMIEVPSGPGATAGEGGTRWHAWHTLNNCWVNSIPGTDCASSIRFENNNLILYAKYINARGGVNTFNVAPYQNIPLISTPIMSQLRAVKAAVKQGPSSVVLNDGDSGISYSSGWFVAGNSGSFIDSSHATTAAGQTAQFTFTGTGINWYSVVSPYHGKADVYIDGRLSSTVDLYSTTRHEVSKVYSNLALSRGSHTIKIQTRSDHNSASQGYYVEVDALEYFRMTRVDDGMATYSGTWGTSTIPSLYASTSHFTTTANSYAQYSFTGSNIAVYGVRSPQHGKMDVYIDGSLKATVDAYQTQWTANTPLFSLTGLTNASHTVKITERSDRNPASTGNYCEIDAFEYGT
jgi:hypothetical protein